MKKFILGFAAALALIALLGFGYVALGLAPVATVSAPLPFEKLITGRMRVSTEKLQNHRRL